MSRALPRLVLMLGLAGVCARAQAQQEGPADVDTEASLKAGVNDAAPTEEVSASAQEHAAGTYAGVLPGGAQPPAVLVKAGTTPATITWPGFQMRPDGTSRVFIQSTAPLPVETASAPGRFIIKMPGAAVAGDTNRLSLDTRFFNTPVTRVNILVGRDGVAITLDLRAPVTPQVFAEKSPSGYHFTYIDLPAGSYLTAADAPKSAEAVAAKAALPAAKAGTDAQHPTFLDGDADLKAKAKAGAAVKAGAQASAGTGGGASAGTPKASAKAKAGIKLGN